MKQKAAQFYYKNNSLTNNTHNVLGVTRHWTTSFLQLTRANYQLKLFVALIVDKKGKKKK